MMNEWCNPPKWKSSRMCLSGCLSSRMMCWNRTWCVMGFLDACSLSVACGRLVAGVFTRRKGTPRAFSRLCGFTLDQPEHPPADSEAQRFLVVRWLGGSKGFEQSSCHWCLSIVARIAVLQWGLLPSRTTSQPRLAVWLEEGTWFGSVARGSGGTDATGHS